MHPLAKALWCALSLLLSGAMTTDAPGSGGAGKKKHHPPPQQQHEGGGGKKQKREKPVLVEVPVDEEHPGNSKFAQALGSTDHLTREKGVQALTRFLVRKADLAEADVLKLWKGLFYCFWHSDKAPVQVRPGALPARPASKCLPPAAAAGGLAGLARWGRGGAGQHGQALFIGSHARAAAGRPASLFSVEWDGGRRTHTPANTACLLDAVCARTLAAGAGGAPGGHPAAAARGGEWRG